MICLACAELRPGDSGTTCVSCGITLVAVTEEHLDALVQARLKRRIEDWRATRLLDASTATRLTESLSGAAIASAAAPLLADAEALERKAEALARKVEALVEDWRPSWGMAFFQALENAARKEREEARKSHEEDEDGIGLASDSGQALFQRVDASVLGGLDAVAALDDAPEGARGEAPKLYEYVWWFLGAVLVLGGSLMGVREAWRALGGVPRQLLVTGALFAYHAGFIGLGTFLARRSASAGRVLASIGIALLPVVFVALSALVELSPGVGLGVSAVTAGLGLLTLGRSGRLLYGASTVSLAVAMLPSLLAGLPLMGLDDAPWVRSLCAFAGVVSLGASAWRARREKHARAGLSVLTTSLYGAAALAVFAVASAPAGFDALTPGDPLFAGMTLWVLALASVIAHVATREQVREAHPQAAPVVEVVSYAGVSAGALLGAVAAFSQTPGTDRWTDVASAFTPLAAAFVFFLFEPRRRALAHPGVLALALGGVLLARLEMPSTPGWWMVGFAAVGAGLLLVARWTGNSALRSRLLTWGVVLSLASLPLTSWAQGWSLETRWPLAVTGALVAVASHLAGGYRWRGLHYLGGLVVLVGASGAVDASGESARTWMQVAMLALAAGLYGVAGLLQEAWARRAGHTNELLPLDDLSLAAATLGVFFACPQVRFAFDGEDFLPSRLATGGLLSTVALGCAPLALNAVILLLRTKRDRSRLVSTLAAGGLALTVMQAFMRPVFLNVDGQVLVLAVLALGFTTIAAFRGRDAEEPTAPARGRRLLGWIRLPFPERGRTLYTDGFAAVSFIVVALTVIALVGWTSVPVETQRADVVLAGELLIGTAMFAFLSRGFVTWRLRGSVGALATAGLFITLTAALNRVGRPLPPDVVALRLPFMGVGIWLLALATRRFGPRLARLLENEPHGRLYHFVPHAGVAALGALLAVEPWLIGGPSLSRALTVVPPLMPLGAALLALLLAGSFRSRGLLHLALLLGLPGATLWATHRTVLGHALVAAIPPGSYWVRPEFAEAARTYGWLADWIPEGESRASLWYRAFAGIASAGFVYAAAGLVLARTGRSALARIPQLWAGRTAGLVFAAAFFQPGLEAAGLVFVSGLLLLVGRAGARGRVVPGIGLLLIVHALAHREPTFGAWPGPVLAFLGLLAVALSPWAARRRGLDPRVVRARAQLGALFYALCAAVYALASGGEPSPVTAVPLLLWRALEGISGLWMRFPALSVTSALVAATLFIGASQWKGALARLGTAWASLLAGLAAVTGLAVGLAHFLETPRYDSLLTRYGAALALGAAAVAACEHVANRWLRTRREDMAPGLGWGRDAWLITTGGLLALVAALVSEPDEMLLPLAASAIALAVAVSLHCAWRERTGRHVYFVQVAVVGVYALVRALYAQDLRPEHDALFALALGFVLVGVTVLAKRAGIPPVERATRRFAALLPLGMALVLPSEATGEAALLAGGSGLLYAALGAVEHSRLFGSLAATACNVALLIGALSMNLDGLEVYLAPLGLLLLMLGQLFTGSLPHAARNAVRTVGGLLLYVPAAAKLSLQLGMAADGTYALVFGAACLLGVAAGMVLHIRAYLALGTLFLTLDVASTLVHAGLRDHRIGFGVMTLTGLTIVGGRVLATMRRQELELLLRRARVTLRGWD